MSFDPDFKKHLETGGTTVARAWEVVRRDGVRMGFTDHDLDLRFDGLTFRADAGLTARALEHSTGLSVDNAEAIGVLNGETIREADIVAGRFDRAEVKAWLVNWKNPAERVLQFRGSIGEIVKSGGKFQAELRGLAEALNAPQGRVYHGKCSAVLGDGACGFDLDAEGFSVDVDVDSVEGARVLRLTGLQPFAEGWFERGRLLVLSGSAQGLIRIIKTDRKTGAGREVEVWEALTAPILAGDRVRVEAGCDKRVETCKGKFSNFPNFRGFPHIPGEDWLLATPRSGEVSEGGSRYS